MKPSTLRLSIKAFTSWQVPLPEYLRSLADLIEQSDRLRELAESPKMLEHKDAYRKHGTSALAARCEKRIQNMDACLCCGKDKRYRLYHPSIGGWLCEQCKKKVMEYSIHGTVDFFGLWTAQEVLEYERELSRMANRLYNLGPDYDSIEAFERKKIEPNLPACPKCLSDEHVGRSAKNKMYYCETCGLDFRFVNEWYVWMIGSTVYKTRAQHTVKYMTPIIC